MAIQFGYIYTSLPNIHCMKPVITARLIIINALFAVTTGLTAQTPILPHAYAHNDYCHKRPLLDALDNGFTYVEADVYLRNGNLVVAHILPCFKKKRTLEALYLKPLLSFVERNGENKKGNGINECRLTLMIDIKSDANKTYEALSLLLDKYRSILSEYEDGRLTVRNVTVVLTGHQPYDLVKSRESRFVFMDEDLRKAAADTSTNLYSIASCKYSRLLKWKGKGVIPEKEVNRLEYYVTQAHKNGCKVRLWASPENKTVWSELLKCNVDLINTDKLARLRNFLLTDIGELAKED